MSLADLHGYWKYGDVAVPFRLPIAPVRVVAAGYVERKATKDPPELRPIETPPAQDVDQDLAEISGGMVDASEAIKSADVQSLKNKGKSKPERPEQRKFDYSMGEKERLVVEQMTLMVEEPPQKALFAISENSAEPAEFGQIDSEMEADQTYL